MGFNFVRIHERSFDRRTLTWADRMGMMVTRRIRLGLRFQRPSGRRLHQNALTLFCATATAQRPSLWVPFNESWGSRPYRHLAAPATPFGGRFPDRCAAELAQSSQSVGGSSWKPRSSATTTGLTSNSRVNYADRESIAELLNEVGHRDADRSGPWSDDRPLWSRSSAESHCAGCGRRMGLREFVPQRSGLRRTREWSFEALEASILAGFCYATTDTRQKQNGLADESHTRNHAE